MADWSTVAAAAVTGATGILSGMIGYRVARLQGRDEAEKLARQQRESRRSERQAAYYGFLDVERKASSRLVQRMTWDADAFDADLVEFNHMYNAVVLYGDEEVTEAAEELRRIYFRAYESGAEAHERSGSWADLVEKFGASFRGQTDDVALARGKLLRAMKNDLGIGPDEPR